MNKKPPLTLKLCMGALVAMSLFWSSCSTSRLTGDASHAAMYLSYPNGLADIGLDLKPNMRFDYRMTILPEPGTTDTLPEKFTFAGRWGNDQSQYIIRFRRRNKPDLYALVSPGYEPETKVVVLDERTIAFPLNDKEVVIWGIRCYRVEGDR
jgi:hypothetical protein